MFKNLFSNISPKRFYVFASKVIPWTLIISIILIFYGLYHGLFNVPPDYQQGDAFRIIYVHVPSAWLSLFAYTTLFICSVVALIWRIKVFEVLSISSAKAGALFTFLALVTGSIWGKPMWGTWWVWDARLTSELILFFIYVAIIILYNSFDDHRKGARAANILAIVGFINIPIIHFSVEWWNTLHQGPTVMKFSSPSISNEMLFPLIYTTIGFTFYFFTALLLSARNILIVREKNSQWVKSI
ncbi:MAG: heme ABC transporter permease [Pelagibacterales bacterium]|nr:heme ABC transporter permease [Pelagibacterales bacterium]